MTLPPRPDRVLVFGRTVVELWPDHARTILPDGAAVTGAPQDTAAYRATAERLGYGADTLRLCVEHEAAHSWLAALLGLAESPTMRGVAQGDGPSELAGIEEDAVLAVQRFARAVGVDLLARIATFI